MFIPQRFFEGELSDFFNDIKELDGEFEKKRAEAETSGMHFRFVARLDDGKVSVGLHTVIPSPNTIKYFIYYTTGWLFVCGRHHHLILAMPRDVRNALPFCGPA